MGEGVSWVTVALTLGAETGTVNSWASAVPTRGVGTGAGEDQSTAALGARTGNSHPSHPHPGNWYRCRGRLDCSRPGNRPRSTRRALSSPKVI